MDPITRGRLTAAEKAQIEIFAERGLTSGQIAGKLNRVPETVGFFMATNGLRSVRMAPEDSAPIIRGTHIVHRFTREEDAFINALRIQNYTSTKIADLATKRFGYRRTPATIGVRLRMIASCAEDT